MTVLVVTGMHRSGTSLVANVLHHAGINMGDDLLPADIGNRHGYYEDALIHDVHVEMMRSAGIDDAFTVLPDALPLSVGAPAAERAREVIAGRSGQERWGWKEPRSALFCDFWLQLVPEATFLFLLRDPTLVLDSLVRRAAQTSINDDPALALDVWFSHNREMLRFSESHGDRCLWWDADAVVRDIAGLIRSVNDATGLSLPSDDLDRLVVRDDFHAKPRMRSRMIERKHRKQAARARELYDLLRERTTR
jgi:hypothetical protein